MWNVVRKILRIVDKMSGVFGSIGAPLPFISAMIICYELIMRKIFEMPTIWAAESTMILGGAWCSFLGGALNLRNDTHVRVDVVYGRFSPRGKAILDCFTFIFFSLYILLMLYVLVPYVGESIRLQHHAMTYWNPPLYPTKVVMFIAFSMIYLQGLARFIRNLFFAVKGEAL